ncbi:hypothetical protein Tco_1014708, partial [Tanacetum coccineum]
VRDTSHLLTEAGFTLPGVDVDEYQYGSVSQSIKREPMVDPSAVFGMVFGSDLFEDDIGELYMGSIQALELKEESHILEVYKQKIQDRMKVFDLNPF